MNRREFLVLASSTAVAASWTGSSFAQEAPKQLRIGYQKNGVLLVAKQQQLFERRFSAQGIEVKFVEFSSGPPLLEALNTGSIDYGTTGDSPPIFAQAARANLVYAAAIPSAGSSSAILVRDGSPIKSVADLKGKKVGFTKASSAHNVTIAALEKVGLSIKDVTPIYLQPSDAAAAFTRGSIDAWTIWDPFFAIAEGQPGTRILISARDVFRQNSFFLANKQFTEKYPRIVAAVNEELAKATEWTGRNREEAAKLFSQATGIPEEIQRKVVLRTEYVFAPVSDEVIAEQQAIADRFHSLGLIPHPVRVRDIVWKWVPNS